MDLKATAQTHAPAKIPRVGFLSSVSAPTGLGDLGYVEGRNINLESTLFARDWKDAEV